LEYHRLAAIKLLAACYCFTSENPKPSLTRSQAGANTLREAADIRVGQHN